jgi:uncharacterized lipoprotein YajG
MSQITNSENKVWVLVSSLKENVKQEDFEQTAPKVSALVDSWGSKGKFVWSGPLDNNKSGMAVFQGTESEAKQLFEEQKQASSDSLDSYLYQWDALPFLSLLN